MKGSTFVSVLAVAAQFALDPSRLQAAEVRVPEMRALRVIGAVSTQAFRHALQRDAWPEVLRCTGASRSARGFTSIVLYAVGHTTHASAEGPVARRDSAFVACVSNALQRVTMPPSEAPERAVLVRFDLYIP
jgi:hypothetical protein